MRRIVPWNCIKKQFYLSFFLLRRVLKPVFLIFFRCPPTCGGFYFIKGGDCCLTDKQKRFCEEYLVDFNATQAAIRAGYSNKTAYSIGDENLRKPELKNYIDERIAEKQSQLIATQDEVLQYLTSVLRGEQKEQTLKMAGVGFQEVEEINISTKDRLKAAELLGKAYGAFRDKVDVSGTVPVVIIDDLEK